MIKEAIEKTAGGSDLSRQEMQAVMEQIMTGAVEVPDIVLFLTALRDKGEAIDEITGAATIMRKHATPIKCQRQEVLDTCGTGGDCSHTFNISTVSAFVAAGAGCVVAKHGNKSVSSKCGSADLLRELGVNIEADTATVERCVNEVGIGFLFAPLLHSAMKYAMPARKQIGTRTIFNILGPLTNPAGARHQLLGVFKKELAEPLVKALQNLGSEHALVVHGEDGLDEATTTAATFVAELKAGKVETYTINPGDFSIDMAKPDDLKGEDASCNAKIALSILGGEKGPKRDIVILNSALAIYAANAAGSIEEGVKKAQESIDSGAAKKKLELLVEASNVS